MLTVLHVLGEECCFLLVSDRDLESLDEGRCSIPDKTGSL